MNSTGKILTAFAIGAAAGAIAGILLAPDKGSETRKKINEQGKKVADEVKSTFRDIKNKFASAKEEVNEKAAEQA